MKVLLGITGSIAAYKAAEIASRLVQKRHEVRAIMTRSACQFITPLTLQTITNNVVIRDLFQPPPEHRPVHITTADWGEVLVVAPATANFLGKVASGIADDALTSTVIAAGCPVIIAPAMNELMYENPVVQGNIKKLRRLGYEFVSPEEGFLADGYRGVGRLADLAKIVAAVEARAKKPKEKPRTDALHAGPEKPAEKPKT